MNNPVDLKYTTSDEWVKIDGNIATIGITDYAQSQLSDVVFVEISVEVGDQVEKKGVVTSLESVKAAAEVSSPVAGEVVEVNSVLSQTPELVNSDPYTKAWMIKVKLSNPSDASALMDAAAYEKYCQERSH
ncbi:MAG: glycine cleavage system protein GcvH [Anaerolineae bacterium]|nr:glycine cleavage system protein GcvH [Anaerolineae bacterium]